MNLGIIGYFGAKKKDHSLLCIYLWLILTIWILEVLAIFLALHFSFQVELLKDNIIKNKLNNALKHNDTSSTKFMDLLQNSFSCCGANSPNDYENKTIPDSCYPGRISTNQVFKNGCNNETITRITESLPVIKACLFTAHIFEIFTLVCTFFALNFTKKSKIVEYDII